MQQNTIKYELWTYFLKALRLDTKLVFTEHSKRYKKNKLWHYFVESTINFDKKLAPDSRIHGANMGPTWVLSAPGGPHVGPMNLAIRGLLLTTAEQIIHCVHISLWIL